MLKSFSEIVNNRRAIKYFKDDSVPDSVIKKGLDQAHLSPSSMNLQPWEFIHVKSASKKKQVAEICLSQSPASSASTIVVFVARPDLIAKRSSGILDLQLNALKKQTPEVVGQMKTLYNKIVPAMCGKISSVILNFTTWVKSFSAPTYITGTQKARSIDAHISCALCAQTFMFSMTDQGYDTCPMTGFDVRRLKKLLKLPRGAEINMLVCVGKREDKTYVDLNRARLPISEVIKTF